jgi:hypothetical protein
VPAGLSNVETRPIHLIPYTTDLLPQARLLDTDDEVHQARRLQAQEYLRAGYLTGDGALTADGTLRAELDPWVCHSRYFGAFDLEGRVRATCRVIQNTAPWPLPTLQLPGIDPSVRTDLARLPVGHLGEISALARDVGVGAQYTRAVFRALWLDALERGLTDWVLSVDRLVLRVLRGMSDTLFRVSGEASPAPVRAVLPVRARPADVTDDIFVRGLTPDLVVLP